jgi:anti-sigma factor RsiW
MRTADHPHDEELEEYCLGYLGEARCAQLEEHLLLCERCRTRVTEMETFIFALRRAGRQWLESGEGNQMTSRGAGAS